MATPDPAERRSIIRGAIECAIRLNPTIRTRQAPPLTASVWRIVEPALAHRDRQIDELHTQLAAATATCDATAVDNIDFFSRPATFGPCILRLGHDGPGHKAANGAEWWPKQTLTVTDLTPPMPISTERLEGADPPVDLGSMLAGWPPPGWSTDTTPEETG
jgi:hypothetical protein